MSSSTDTNAGPTPAPRARKSAVPKVAAAVVIVVLVIGAGLYVFRSNLTGSSSTAGKTLIIGSTATYASLDPAVAFDTASVLFDDQIYNTLIGYGTTTYNGTTVGSLTPVPELATSWVSNANGSVTFTLRQGVNFVNPDGSLGPVFNASDVQFSLDRIITMKQGADFHVFTFLNESGIHVLGPYSVMLVPSRPYPWFLNLFQLWVTGIVNPAYINAHGGVVAGKVNTFMTNNAMGTGPYLLNSTSTSQIVIVANPHYWGGAPKISKVIYEITPSATTQQTELEGGAINIALNIPYSQMSSLATYKNVQVSSGPTSSEYYIGLDENVTPFNNTLVRQAMEFATNQTELVKYSTYGFGIPIQSVIAKSIESYTPAFKNYSFNPAKARALLQQAGYGHGFTTTFYYTSGDPVGAAIFTILQQELNNVGVNITGTPLQSGTFNDEAGHGTFPMFFEGWVNLLATPEDGLFPLFYNGNLGIYGNYNYYNNSTASHLLLTAGETLNATQRDSMYAQVQNMLGQAAVEIPLFNLQNVIPHTTNVHDLYVYPTFDMYFDQAYMT